MCPSSLPSSGSRTEALYVVRDASARNLSPKVKVTIYIHQELNKYAGSLLEFTPSPATFPYQLARSGAHCGTLLLKPWSP